LNDRDYLFVVVMCDWGKYLKKLQDLNFQLKETDFYTRKTLGIRRNKARNKKNKQKRNIELKTIRTLFC